MKSVSSIEDCAKFITSSTRLRVSFHNKKIPDIAIKFEGGGKENFLLLAQKTLLKKSWEEIDKSKETSEAENKITFSSSNAGVSGIIRRQEKQLSSIDNVTKSASVDLDALMQQVMKFFFDYNSFCN